jgi:hypothetical protein
MAALAGSDYCWNHAPEVAADRARARRKGGEHSRTPYAVEPSPEERPSLRDMSVVALAERAVADTLQQPNTSHRSRTLLQACLVALRVHEVGEMEERLAAIEARLNRMTPTPTRLAG